MTEQPAAWIRQELQRVVLEHGGDPTIRHRGEYRIMTPTGWLDVGALVVSDQLAWLAFTRMQAPPEGAQAWLNENLRPYMDRSRAAGVPSYLAPAATRYSGELLLAPPQAAAALAEWLPQELAWQAEVAAALVTP